MTVARRVLMSLEDPQVPISSASISELFGGETLTDSGTRVTEKKVLGIPATWRAVNVVAGSSAALPLHAFSKKDGKREQVESKLLDSPHLDLTPFELWEINFGHMLLWGNSYQWKKRNQLDEIRELWPIHPSRVKPGRATDGTKVYQIDGDKGYSDRDILHIPGFGYDGIAGIAPVTAARQVLVRLTDAQHARLDALAQTWGCTAQAALRRLLDEATTATAADVVTLRVTREALWRYVSKRKDSRPGDPLFETTKHGALDRNALRKMLLATLLLSRASELPRRLAAHPDASRPDEPAQPTSHRDWYRLGAVRRLPVHGTPGRPAASHHPSRRADYPRSDQ